MTQLPQTERQSNKVLKSYTNSIDLENSEDSKDLLFSNVDITFTPNLENELMNSDFIPNTKNELFKKLGIDYVIVNNEVTVVILKNGNKGVARCDKQDKQDLEVGFALAYMLAISTKGNKTKYKKIISNILE